MNKGYPKARLLSTQRKRATHPQKVINIIHKIQAISDIYHPPYPLGSAVKDRCEALSGCLCVPSSSS